MRLFEALFVLVSVFMLVALLVKPPRAIWIVSAAALLVAFLLHGALEGFRWQMVPAYLCGLVLAIVALAGARGLTFRLCFPRVLTIVATVPIIGALALSSFLAHALPVFALPAPTGEYAVGFQYLHLIDERRADPFLADGARRREIMVKVYYPVEPDDSRPYGRYFDGSTELLRAYARFYGLPSFAFGHFGLVRTHAQADLAPSNKEREYPIVLFSHGAGATVEVGTSQGEDLASHGYIVVTIDHTYVSAATAFPDRLVTAREATTDFAVPEPAEPITQIMADDARLVIDRLGELNAGGIAPGFTGRLDLGRIGVIGHSVGGATAYNLALSDRRVKAAINLDGVVYVTPRAGQVIAPLLMLANDRYHAQAIARRESLVPRFDGTPEGQQMLRDRFGTQEGYEAQYRKAEQHVDGLVDALNRSGGLYTIAGSDHMTFTDIGLFIGNGRLRELLQIGGVTDPARCLTITQALTVAFFDQHLKGDGGALESVGTAYPELRRVPLD